MKKFLLAIALSAACATFIPAKVVKTTRPNLKLKETAKQTAEPEHIPTLVFAGRDSVIVLSGFDKKLSSDRESFFVTNRSDSTDITRIVFTIKYLDMQQRQLHLLRRNLRVDIPAGETRYVSFRSFDRQHSFYYEKSGVPRVRAAAFSIVAAVDSVFCVPSERR